MGHSDDRYNKAIERLSGEAFWLNTYQSAILGMEIDAIGLDFFRVSLNALQDARLVRLIRVLEDHNRVASLWYVLKCNSGLVEKCAKIVGFDIDAARQLSAKLPGIRTQTIMHLDKTGILNPKKVYEDAGVTFKEIDEFIKSMWLLMQVLHVEVLGKEIRFDVYTGEDIKHLSNLRDEDIQNKNDEIFDS